MHVVSEQTGTAQTVTIPLVWVGGEEMPLVSVNQMVVQVHEGEVFLTMGSLIPPLVLAETEEDRRRQAEQVGYVPVRTVAKLSLTRRRLRELIEVLGRGEKMLDAEEQT